MPLSQLLRARPLAVVLVTAVAGVSAAYAAGVMPLAGTSRDGSWSLGLAPMRGSPTPASSHETTAVPGHVRRVRVTLRSGAGFAGKVRLSTGALPPGVRVSFSRPILRRGLTTAVMRIALPADLARGAVPIAVVGTGPGGRKLARLTLQIAFLRIVPGTITLAPGDQRDLALSLRTGGEPRIGVENPVPGLSATVTRPSAGRATMTLRAGPTTAVGSYVLTVRARLGRLLVAVPLSVRVAERFEANSEQDEGESFTVSGDAPQLMPGATRPLDLKLTARRSDVRVTALNVRIAAIDAPRAAPGLGCSADDFSITPVRSGVPALLPAGKARSLVELGIAPPAVTMLDRPVNQDGCQGATVRFAYDGTVG